MTVSGTTTDTIAVENNASGSTITSGVKANVSLNADAKVSLEKGAEGSAVKTGSEAVKADVTNNTSEKVTLTDASGKDLSIATGKTSDEATTPENTGGSTGGNTCGDSDPGTEEPDEPAQKTLTVTPGVDQWTVGTTLTASVSGVEDVVYSLKIGDAEAVPSSALSYTIVADDVDKTLTISAATPSGDAVGTPEWTGFNSAVTDEQSGYYLPLQFAVPSDVTNYTAVTVKTANPDSANPSKDFGYADFDPANGESSSDSNPKTVFSAFFYVKSTETVKTITIDWDGTGKEYEETTYTLDLSGLTLAEKPSGTTE